MSNEFYHFNAALPTPLSSDDPTYNRAKRKYIEEKIKNMIAAGRPMGLSADLHLTAIIGYMLGLDGSMRSITEQNSWGYATRGGLRFFLPRSLEDRMVEVYYYWRRGVDE